MVVIERELKKAAQGISEALGYRGSDGDAISA
jgi:hypothetical protein